MKVQQLFLRNVRSIKDLDLDFRDPITGKPMSRIVLAGANGSGKTTILESIFNLIAAAPKYNDETELEKIYLSPGTQLQIVFDIELIQHTFTTLSIFYGNEVSIKPYLYAEGKQIKPNLKERDSLTSRRFAHLELESDVEELSAFAELQQMIRSAITRDSKAPGSILYFPHNRYLASAPKGELGYEPRIYEWAYKYQAAEQWKGSTESYLFSLNYLDLEDRDRRLPGNRFSQAVEFVNSILDEKRIARIEKGRVVVETKAGVTHGLDSLSSGEKQLALLLIEIMRRIVRGSIILIDELEISLHPTWQRGLMTALDKIIEQYDAQIILATHSLEIAASVMPYEVIGLNDLGLPRGKWEPEKNIAQIAEAILSRTAGAETITLAQKVQSKLKDKDDLVEYVANFNPETAEDLNSPSTLLEVAELIAEHLKE